MTWSTNVITFEIQCCAVNTRGNTNKLYLLILYLTLSHTLTLFFQVCVCVCLNVCMLCVCACLLGRNNVYKNKFEGLHGLSNKRAHGLTKISVPMTLSEGKGKETKKTKNSKHKKFPHTHTHTHILFPSLSLWCLHHIHYSRIFWRNKLWKQ